MFDLKITERCHMLMRPFVKSGDVVVDATCGNGYDTFFLSEQVGADGVVIAMDIQYVAYDKTRRLMKDSGLEIEYHEIDRLDHWRLTTPGCHFILGSHARLDSLTINPKVIMFNLGFLPGGNRQVTTVSEQSITAIRHGLEILAADGVMSVITYPGHTEGNEEHEDIMSMLEQLPTNRFEVITILQTNRSSKTPVQHLIRKQK